MDNIEDTENMEDTENTENTENIDFALSNIFRILMTRLNIQI